MNCENCKRLECALAAANAKLRLVGGTASTSTEAQMRNLEAALAAKTNEVAGLHRQLAAEKARADAEEQRSIELTNDCVAFKAALAEERAKHDKTTEMLGKEARLRGVLETKLSEVREQLKRSESERDRLAGAVRYGLDSVATDPGKCGNEFFAAECRRLRDRFRAAFPPSVDPKPQGDR